MARFCTSCGARQSGDGSFCEDCGVALPTSIASGTTSGAAPVAAVPAVGGKGFPTMLVAGGVIALLAVAGLVALLFSRGGGGPAEIAKEFYWAAEKGNVEEARNLMASQIRAFLSEQKLGLVLVQQRAESARRGGLHDIEVLDETIDGQHASVRLKLVYGNGSTENVGGNMLQEDGHWKISPGN